MPASIGARLRAARHQRQVGRDAEIRLFRAAVEADTLPFCLLYVYGPGGVGKTTLLHAFAAACDERQTPAIWLDGRHIEPTPDAFLSALCVALSLDSGHDPLAYLHTSSDQRVLLVDTYEELTSLDGWLRDRFLPELPENVFTVLSGRLPPDAAWYGEAGWQEMFRAVPLRNFSPDESAAYLSQHAIPPEEHAAILDFTHGYPLALSLVTDVFARRGSLHFDPDSAQDIVQALLERLVQNVPDATRRAALQSCALVHLTTESLLAELNPQADAHALFAWLRDLSFIEVGWRGLFPHDIAREALLADLRWRDPDRYADLHRRARAYYNARLQTTQGQEQQRILFDYIFLHRDNAIVRAAFQWQDGATAFVDNARPEDSPALVAMTEQHEGEQSASLLKYWLAQPIQKTLVFRDIAEMGRAGEPLGFMMLVRLDQVSPEQRERDPAIHAACRHLERSSPLRPGESALYYRFWMGRDTYQSVSTIQSLIIVNIIRQDLMTPNLAYTFHLCQDAEFWAPVFAYAQKQRLPDADFTVGDHHYGVFGHDWRVMPTNAWLTVLAEQELDGETEVEPRRTEPLLVLSEPEFWAATREALRGFQNPESLRANPLLRSRLVVERIGAQATPAARADTLCALIKEACDVLESSPRLARGCQAVYHTYLHPAPTQEMAAEHLDLPFSTYRRHLTEGVAQITEWLWRKEIGGTGEN